MLYFQGLSVEDIKKKYRQLAKESHPDLGGLEETMQEINRQYHEALKGQHGTSKDGHTYRYNQKAENEVSEKLLELLKLRSLDISLIGLWLWVTGDTRKNKDALKQLGLKWHSKRKCWYFKPTGWKKSRQSNGDLQDLAAKYGYKNFKTADKEHMPVKQ